LRGLPLFQKECARQLPLPAVALGPRDGQEEERGPQAQMVPLLLPALSCSVPYQQMVKEDWLGMASHSQERGPSEQNRMSTGWWTEKGSRGSWLSPSEAQEVPVSVSKERQGSCVRNQWASGQ
jgi:hypothetical protein